MANQARQSPPESINNNNHTTSPVSNSVHNASAPYYHHHYHTSSSGAAAAVAIGNNTGSNAGYSPPQNGGLNGNESPSSVDQFSNNNIQLPETPNSLVTTMMGPTSGNSNSNDGTNAINDSENATIIANNNNNNNYSPWCTATSGHHQLPLNNSPIHSTSYNSAHHPSASLYSAAAAAHHNLLPHQNISSFVQHPQKGFNHHLSQPFYSWY